MYVKFFRWAIDRLQGRDGIVCFVSNNGFLQGITFDGFRKHLGQDFDLIYHFDTRGNKRLIGMRQTLDGRNVFNDMVRVGRRDHVADTPSGRTAGGRLPDPLPRSR